MKGYLLRQHTAVVARPKKSDSGSRGQSRVVLLTNGWREVARAFPTFYLHLASNHWHVRLTNSLLPNQVLLLLRLPVISPINPHKLFLEELSEPTVTSTIQLLLFVLSQWSSHILLLAHVTHAVTHDAGELITLSSTARAVTFDAKYDILSAAQLSLNGFARDERSCGTIPDVRQSSHFFSFYRWHGRRRVHLG